MNTLAGLLILDLESFLIEITGHIFKQRDPDTGAALVDLIADAASMKGTGSWTVQEASGIGAPVPSIASRSAHHCAAYSQSRYSAK